MFLGSTNEKATLYITGWRSVYGKPTLRYQHVVYQNLAEDCHELARMQAGRKRSSRSTSSDIFSLTACSLAPARGGRQKGSK
jgi:hypothetical protein